MVEDPEYDGMIGAVGRGVAFAGGGPALPVILLCYYSAGIAVAGFLGQRGR